MDNAHRVVSSESEELILVDDNDREGGYLSKAACHDGDGILHRAFSVFLFDPKGRLLLQQRAHNKRLWPGFWSNTCCSHPRRGESLEIATERRLTEELNVVATMEYVYQFMYQAQYLDLGSERELCHVYVGRIASPVAPNHHEIAEIRYASVAEIDADLERYAERFTPWFRMEWQALKGEHAELLSRYAM
ncbi:MAG: isopentenyl-diphosphate Delta-isomerase [Woeseiaceae bacterium]|nr:isopentenyl-diphosphate Delta-isomerase [Woeseiaceae bacterium]